MYKVNKKSKGVKLQLSRIDLIDNYHIQFQNQLFKTHKTEPSNQVNKQEVAKRMSPNEFEINPQIFDFNLQTLSFEHIHDESIGFVELLSASLEGKIAPNEDIK